MLSEWRNIVHQRKPYNKQFIASEGYENPGKNGKTKAKERESWRQCNEEAMAQFGP
jgi:hypothetical protein